VSIPQELRPPPNSPASATLVPLVKPLVLDSSRLAAVTPQKQVARRATKTNPFKLALGKHIQLYTAWSTNHTLNFLNVAFCNSCVLPSGVIGRGKTSKSQTSTLAPSSGSSPNCQISLCSRAGSLRCCH